jgi:hypothetical protein
VVEPTMDVTSWLRKQLEQASPDLLRAMVKEMAEALMGAEADAVCGAGYGQRTPERVNIRNGYREPERVPWPTFSQPHVEWAEPDSAQTTHLYERKPTPRTPCPRVAAVQPGAAGLHLGREQRDP